MKRILPYFIFLANLILVLVVAWSLGFDLPIANGKTKISVYAVIALLLYGTENWLIDKIRGYD